MKRIVILLTFMSFGVIAAQTAVPPVTKPAVTEATKVSPTPLQRATIDNAIKDWQLASYAARDAENNVGSVKNAALQAIATVQKELNLDNSWQYDEAKKVYEKKPKPAETTTKPAEPTKVEKK